MLTLENIASNYFETNLELEITKEKESFQQSKVCWPCGGSFAGGGSFASLLDCGDKVRDHNHLTGKYRGAAHNRCNLNCKKSQVRLFPYFSIISVGMIVILCLKNS